MSSSRLLNVLVFALLLILVDRTTSLQCWQCASVDGRSCPEHAKLVNSSTHDACITWRLGNGTVILQNVVKFEDECTYTKVDFWTRFINLYYQSTAGEVRCCDADGCNTGAFTDDFYIRPSTTRNGLVPSGVPPGAPLIFGDVSSAPPLAGGSGGADGNGGNPGAFGGPTAQPPHNLAQLNIPMPSYAVFGGNGLISSQFGSQQGQFLPQQQQGQFQYPQRYPQQPQITIVGSGNPSLSVPSVIGNPSGGQLVLGLDNTPTFTENGTPITGANGNCQSYFNKKGDGEWLPNTLVPLSFDRASETKIGVFYARFTSTSGNNDHVIVRLVGSNKSNSTMYSFKLYRVGSVSLFISKLEANNAGTIQQLENRETSQNDVINITDTNYYAGFWFTVKDEEITLGQIGDELINPVVIWNDTKRAGPKDVAYFSLTTDQSQASFGINCDVPNLHFEDTCVTDENCEEYPNTVCASSPLNPGLDPGTRKIPFHEWKPRDSLLKSCFCRSGHLRIPDSKGCYDPIRQVVTLKDGCFANYHCKDLPNTQCAFDKDVAKFNMSCQCVPGNKPFEADPRTGLIEGCAPLTDADRASVLGCANKVNIDDGFAWKPDDLYTLDRDGVANVDYGVVYVKLAGSVKNRNDVAIVRLLDESKNSRKMLSIKFYRQDGKIAITESARSSSFFFESEHDVEKATIDDLDVMTRMQLDYVGFWIWYKYDDSLNAGTICIGLNGSPFSSDYALVKWVDNSQNAIKKLRYVGFTGSQGSHVHYGTNCLLLDTPVGIGGKAGGGGTSPFIVKKAPISAENVASGNFAAAAAAAGSSLGNIYGNPGGTNLNNAAGGQQLQQQYVAGQGHPASLQSYQNYQAYQNYQLNLQRSAQAAYGAGGGGGAVGTTATGAGGGGSSVQSRNGLDPAGLAQQQHGSMMPSVASSVDPYLNFNIQQANMKAAADAALSSTDAEADEDDEAEKAPKVDEPEVIIEPVLRNEYLTKIKRLLPTFFEDFKDGEIEAATRAKKRVIDHVGADEVEVEKGEEEEVEEKEEEAVDDQET